MKQPDLKANERELLKLIRFFGKRAQKLMDQGTLSTEHTQLTTACQNLETQLQSHAENRAVILGKRERLQQIIEDNAQCPKCGKNDLLKRTGSTRNERGWSCNTYKCRRCNITFTWNRPNNPWDMVQFMEAYIQELEQQVEQEQNEDLQAHTRQAMLQLNDSLSRLRPVLETSDEEVAALHAKEKEMDKLIHQFKTYLQIEKIKLDAYPEPDAGS